MSVTRKKRLHRAESAIKYAYKKYLSYRTARLDDNVTPLK